jgi:ECF transporter S component (folate family)
MKFREVFKNSAKELKSTQCIVVTGMLIAVYIVLAGLGNVYLIPGVLRINFGFLALATIGMLYGPTAAILAAVPCDLFALVMRGTGGFLPIFTLILMFNGFIYGMFLYGFEAKRSFLSNVKLFVAHGIVVLIGRLVFNTAAQYLHGIIGGADETLFTLISLRIGINVIRYPVDIIMLYAVLIPVKAAFPKITANKYKTEESE